MQHTAAFCYILLHFTSPNCAKRKIKRKLHGCISAPYKHIYQHIGKYGSNTSGITENRVRHYSNAVFYLFLHNPCTTDTKNRYPAIAR